MRKLLFSVFAFGLVVGNLGFADEDSEKCYNISLNGKVWSKEDSFCIDHGEKETKVSFVGGAIGRQTRFLTFKGEYMQDKSTEAASLHSPELSENSLYKNFKFTMKRVEKGKTEVSFNGAKVFYINK